MGTSAAQTQEIVAKVEAAGVHGAVGLQARMSPAAVRALELVRSGAIGRVLSTTVFSSTPGFGEHVDESALYLEKPETGMNLATIQMAHTVDLAVHLAGQLESLAALTTIRFPTLQVEGLPEGATRTLPDQVLIHGRMTAGGALDIQVVGGRPADDSPFRMDIVGDGGVLTVSGGGPRGFQASLLSVALNGQVIEVDPLETAQVPNSVVNVASIYAALRNDIRHDTTTAPTFQDAVRLTHLVDDIMAAADDGRRTTPSAEWP